VFCRVLSCVQYCYISLFADYSLIYITVDTLEEAVEKMNEDLASLAVWLCHNKLKLNILIPKKHSKRADSIKIGEEKLECVE
jgi:hypothetical protein